MIANYALVLDNGEIITPVRGWYRNDQGEIIKDVRYFFWVSNSFDIGEIRSGWMAREYFDGGHLKGVWASKTFGRSDGDFYPINRIRNIIPWEEVAQTIQPVFEPESIPEKKRRKYSIESFA